MPGKKVSSVGSPDGKGYNGDEGKWDDGDADIDEGDNLHDDEDLSDGSEYKPPGGNDDSCSIPPRKTKNVNANWTRFVIEYSNSKKTRHGRHQTTVILGGPMRPNYEGMTDAEKEHAKDEYKRKRKAFTHQRQVKCLKEAANTEIEQYTGCLHPTLQTMAEVEKSRLQVGHTFPDKDLLKLRVAKEANCHGIHFYILCSKVHQYKAYGERFTVEANNNETANGFYVSV
jgi:hypothetical protein